ncbi:serine protein kinase, PrkA [Halorubrum californiense DSM 19288]|uniref:Serine protein kinase, PrkA n=1 Tax=Halorubrum californiense DSM 19288 TaxID=1227465 RepID=M0E148_9EURY|nr:MULTISPECIES: serine protein kinase PrkA [Halorubrum]ELZ41505.1 serine protein kinase, PrkA [Halorubrum californiense DSM 19288]TKX65847.1 kinase anchor protein [Halorubrum sp. GN11GM_10-3_MGM]
MSERTRPDGEGFVDAADEALRGAYDPPMSLAAYVDRVLERPTAAASGAGYVLAAIESQGTREVRERGETLDRYRFFDDPANGGEHAVLGNTRALNAFVDDLRAAATGRGNDETIVWIDGPTATGKSEFKRCLVNGLRAFSKTDAGRRYTVEWNVTGAGAGGGGGSGAASLSYGDGGDTGAWYRSPVQTHPLSVFPEPVRESIADAVDGDAYPIAADVELDPFSREAYDHLESTYREQGRRDLFSAITDRDHLRVTSYVVDVGRGIGVLHAEDDGTPKERLVGSWMGGMLRELDSRGRKNPQAFSYDGVLSQGNGVATVVEDASQHADLLRRLLNVPDERRVKLDKGIGMDLDTQLIVISNPDLDAELDRHAERGDADPLKALKRRLSKHEFRYLTNRRLEARLLRREIAGATAAGGVTIEGDADQNGAASGGPGVGAVAAGADADDAGTDPGAAPLSVDVRESDGSVAEREIAPHAIGAAALYAVVTRLDADGLPGDLDLIETAELYETGQVGRGDDAVTVADVDLAAGDGRNGIPVTYARDAVADLLATTADRQHPDLPVERVVTPTDVLDAMADGLVDAPLFSRAEVTEFEGRRGAVATRIRERQREDVIDAMLAKETVSTETVAEYVEHVYAWDDEDPTTRGREDEAPDPLVMKVFETETLGRFDESDYRGTEPGRDIEQFRRKRVIRGLTQYAWRNRDDAFGVDEVDLAEVPELKAVIHANDLTDVKRRFPDLDPAAWPDPPADTETERVKKATVDRLCERGYSRASAELTSRAVMEQVRDEWSEVDGGRVGDDPDDGVGQNGGESPWD